MCEEGVFKGGHCRKIASHPRHQTTSLPFPPSLPLHCRSNSHTTSRHHLHAPPSRRLHHTMQCSATFAALGLIALVMAAPSRTRAAPRVQRSLRSKRAVSGNDTNVATNNHAPDVNANLARDRMCSSLSQTKENRFPVGDMKYTLKSWYMDHTNGGSGKGSVCGELCRADSNCNSWMWRNSGNTCYLSVDKELKLKPAGCCSDHHPSRFGFTSCSTPPARRTTTTTAAAAMPPVGTGYINSGNGQCYVTAGPVPTSHTDIQAVFSVVWHALLLRHAVRLRGGLPEAVRQQARLCGVLVQAVLHRLPDLRELDTVRVGHCGHS